jgi:hypothetical protein
MAEDDWGRQHQAAGGDVEVGAAHAARHYMHAHVVGPRGGADRVAITRGALIS